MSSHANRTDHFKVHNSYDKRQSVTAADSRTPQSALFSPEEMENLKLNHLREKRKQLEEKLRFVANKINFRKKKEEQQLRKFIRSQEKSLQFMETHNYKKFNEMMKEEYQHRREFENQKKAKEVEQKRSINQRRLSLISQAVKDRKLQESEKLRYAKKMDQQQIKFSRQMAFSAKKQRHEAINKMKDRQHAKKRCFWFEKRMSFQNKLDQEASIYEKQIEQYFHKIQALKENEEKLKEQELQAQQVLKNAQQNFSLLKNS